MRYIFSVGFLLCASLHASSIVPGIVTTGNGQCRAVTSGFITGVNGATLTAVAEYEYSDYFTPTYSTCKVTTVADYTTLGPPQDGFIQYDLFGSTETSDGFGASTSLYINGVKVGSCGEFFCSPEGTVPIELGSNFEVAVTASGFENGNAFGSALIQANISVFVGDPQYVDVLPADIVPMTTPEPNTLLLFGIGLITLRLLIPQTLRS